MVFWILGFDLLSLLLLGFWNVMAEIDGKVSSFLLFRADCLWNLVFFPIQLLGFHFTVSFSDYESIGFEMVCKWWMLYKSFDLYIVLLLVLGFAIVFLLLLLVIKFIYWLFYVFYISKFTWSVLSLVFLLEMLLVCSLCKCWWRDSGICRTWFTIWSVHMKQIAIQRCWS